MRRFLSLLLSVCLLSALALTALAAGDGDDPNVYVNKAFTKTTITKTATPFTPLTRVPVR